MKNKNYSQNQPRIPKEPQLTVYTDTDEINPGESVNEHEQLKAANVLIGTKEIGQQNNNL